ncbi:MAG: ABC transporter permease subunit [Proteobacteria bacterium]|nr:ABC transporter permease subunit [Pseudomonadota bacterium]MBU1060580.1 ABC transporter permease subunit [Pseudomonadota bacterium]
MNNLRAIPLMAVSFAGALMAISLLNHIVTPPLPNLDQMLLPPSIDTPLGTDGLGRNVSLRLLIGTSYSLEQAAITIVIASFVGLSLAVLSAHAYGRWLDGMISSLAEAVRSFPTLILVLLFAAAGAPPMLLLATYFWVPVWRLLRGELISQQHQPYAMTTRLAGMSPARTLTFEVLPNVLPRVYPYAAGLFAEVLTAQTAVEYLGFGPPIEQTSIGGLILESGRLGLSAPWVWMPALLMVSILVALLAGLMRSRRKSLVWTPLG